MSAEKAVLGQMISDLYKAEVKQYEKKGGEKPKAIPKKIEKEIKEENKSSNSVPKTKADGLVIDSKMRNVIRGFFRPEVKEKQKESVDLYLGSNKKNPVPAPKRRRRRKKV